jgi:hypothetical protein
MIGLGQGFTVGRFPVLIFLEIADETRNDGTGSNVQGFKAPFSSPDCILDAYLREI